MATKIKKQNNPNHQDIAIALTALNNVCKANNVSLAGFIWDGANTLYNFGCAAAKQIETYEKLVTLAEHRRKTGQVIKSEPLRTN